MLNKLKEKGRVRVLVKPSKQVSRIIGWDKRGNLVVEVDAPATQNKANLALVKLFKSKGFRAFLETGYKSRYKTLRLQWDFSSSSRNQRK